MFDVAALTARAVHEHRRPAIPSLEGRRKLFGKGRKKVANAAINSLSALFALARPMGQAMTEARVISKLETTIQLYFMYVYIILCLLDFL